MPSTDIGMRLPRYEGHLILNNAVLSDGPQTSNGTAWSERWCSLEDGKLLVYTDRTAAMVNPEETCAVIDVHSFACVQVLSAMSDSGYELVLSTTLPEPARSSRLFRPKSAMSLSRLQADSVSRQNSVEMESRSSMASFSRASMSSRPLHVNELSTLSGNTDTAADASKAGKSWSNFGFRSRRLNSKLASASNGSLRASQASASRPGSTTSSFISNSDPRASTDVASSRAPSPRTPISPTFGSSCENVLIRVTSAHSFTSWFDALTLTIKMHREMISAPSPVLKQQSRASTRPALSNLPGFRTSTTLQTSPAFPSVEHSILPCAHDTTPKASRKRHSSSASFSLALGASRHMQDIIDDRSDSHGDASNKAATSVAFAEHISFGQARNRRPSTADAWSTIAPPAGGTADVRRVRQARAHKRSISTASSSLSFSAASRRSDQRCNSVSGTQLLSSGSTMTQPLDTSLEEDSLAPNSPCAPASSSNVITGDTSVRQQDAAKPTSNGTTSGSRHRRSGSLMTFGSARILAWRDAFTAAETTTGLGLQVDQGDGSFQDPADCSRDTKVHGKPIKTFSGFKSLRSLVKGKATAKEANVGASTHRDGSVGLASPSEPRGSEEVLRRSAAQSNSRVVSSSTSLLSITKHTLASLRERSSSTRPSVRTVFAAASAEEAETADILQGVCKQIHTAECDFSYELVAPSEEADILQGSLPSSAEQVSEASEIPHLSGTASTTDKESDVGVDISIAEKLAQVRLQRSFARDGDDDTSSPFVFPERILPPKQIIDTFDKLRAADPTGRSCDWLTQLESANAHRSSWDWATASASAGQVATTATRRPSLRTAASQILCSSGGGPVDWLAAPRLRSAASAWDLPSHEAARGAPGAESVDRKADARVVQATRSLPAPPRAVKRRARASASQPSREVRTAGLSVDDTSPVTSETATMTTTTTGGRAFADITNISGNSTGNRAGKADPSAGELSDFIPGLMLAPRSPARRLGAKRRLSGAAASPAAAPRVVV
ncbi:hypothetical protein EX895_001017 [Sporisorium graminicola]|uniref:PH domain-containing protein n=1 Tax=Sporisorium graminicola TaxID=280036 RepID=A0A4U7L4V5_9BASI|nr:hypothetical protein EX895_001017 [Sporisorium graminicola]TKY91018.1 hypothetical protein EX895_001017 [Sporisorium graminicola]